MHMVIFVALLFYAITNIVCVVSARCPCHIPCTGRPETCTCWGECGDDGYGCKGNGDDYEYLDELQCRENEWAVQCIRTSKCSITSTLDDTNPYAAYEQAAKDNILENDFDSDIIDQENSASSSAQSMQWFGGNWFDFFGKNSDQFFNEESMMNNDDEKYIKMKNNQDDDFQDNDISIDNQDFDSSITPQSSQRTLQNAQKRNHGPVLDDLGRNEAGYKIIALPLYILIICIVASALLGMLMCAGFVYCGLHCCCPLPPSSPTLTSQQRSRAVAVADAMRSLTLGGGQKQQSNNEQHDVYHRMGRYLHNPTNDEASSISSLSPRHGSRRRGKGRGKDKRNNDNDDEYANDSEDDKKENHITRGNIDDMDDDYDYDESKGGDDNDDVIIKNDYDREPFALKATCDSDIGGDDSEDEMMMQQFNHLIQSRQSGSDDNYKDIDIEEEEEEEEEQQQQQIEEEEEVQIYNDNNNQEVETEYDDDDELRPLKSNRNNDNDNNNNNNEMVNEDMLGMVTVDRDSDDEDDIDPDPEVTETENEGLPLLNNRRENYENDSAGNNSVATVSTYKSKNLP